MKCVNCDSKRELRASRVTLKYDISGLDNVVLLNVEEHRCDKCGEVYHNLGNMKQLHELIAGLLIRQSHPLNSKEIRFLRTHLGYSGKMFAKLMGYTYETVSRFESGSRPVPTSFDHALRAMVFTKYRSTDYDLHDQILNRVDDTKEPRAERLEIKRSNSGWTQVHA